MSKFYEPQTFEAKWREYWEKNQVYKSVENPDPSKKKYCLSMFPYPSGDGLHVGHVRIYTGTDVLARFFRMKGYEVLHPMGWDAFGLPAENAAIKAKKNPLDMVPKNMENFKRQMQSLGLSYDWNRELATTDPEYYQFTQWLFILFFKLGLLYKKDTPVYYCPFCKTGLAEEEVLPDGTHERCGKIITRKNLPQWIFKITEYADSLLATLKELEWPVGILEMQKNWIGKDTGLQIAFKEQQTGEAIPVWTKFWETIYGTTFLVVAPEHELAKKSRVPEVVAYVQQALAKTDEQRLKDEKQKSGVFLNQYALNPVNQKAVPIYVADYVLANVGTGAVMGVPAHDERDFAFAKKYSLPIIQVVEYADAELNQKVATGESSHEGQGKLVNSAKFDHLPTPGEGKEKMAEWLIKENLATWKTNYHLRDWIFSRQRYWGEPIPIVYCQNCAKAGISYWSASNQGVEELVRNNKELKQSVSKRIEKVQDLMAGYFPLETEELPLKLPYINNYEPTNTGESPLSRVADWVKTTCPHCGGEAVRETDTMPNWAGSCWYFLRFAWKEKVMEKTANMDNPYLPVDWYLGGAEHAVLHLLYARFWIHILNDLGLVNFREPFLRLRNVGMVLAEDHRKMSKSLGNVVNPDSVVVKFGADTLRVYEMFMAPFNMEISWSISSMLGANRFLGKVYQLYTSSAKITNEEAKEDKNLSVKLQTTIEKVGNDITNVKFNTAIASLMEFVNSWQKSTLSSANAKKFLQLLAPFAPFLTEELWQTKFQETKSIHNSLWPEAEKTEVQKVDKTVPVQVNGKIRALIQVPADSVSDQKEVEKLALRDERVVKHLTSKNYKVIYVPGKILNFLLS